MINLRDDINAMSLLDLFLMETTAQCENITNELAMFSSGSSISPNAESIKRAVHSIKGAAKIVDISLIINLTKAMECTLQETTPESLGTDKLKQLFEACIDQLNHLSKAGSKNLKETLRNNKNLINNLIKSLENFDDQTKTPSESVSPAVAPSAPSSPHFQEMSNLGLFQIFKEDAENHISVLYENLIQIEKKPDAVTLLEASMRAIHSLKGAARIIELHQIVKLTHHIEDIFVAAQDRNITLTPDSIDTLLASIDILKSLIKEDETSIEYWLNNNSKKIDTTVNELSSIRTLSQDVPSPQVEDNLKDSQKEQNQALERRSRPNRADRRKSRSLIERDQTLRVSAKGMSRMMGLAGEAMVESRWLPTLSGRTVQLKRKQDMIWNSLSKLHKHFIETEITPYIESRFESINAKVRNCQEFLSDYLSEIDVHARTYSEISHRLHKEIITSRMQPFAEGIKGMPRLIRDLGRKFNKQIRLEVSGAETLVDRDILEKLDSPITHLVTNAIDHGIELPDEREDKDKHREAIIIIEAKHVSGMLHITVSDDGRGIDTEKLRKKVVEKKLVSQKIASDLTEYELHDFLFLPNFTTKKTVTKTSGRGVGLDIVHDTIRKIRGSVQLTSILGKGTFFEIKLPLTLSIIRGLIVEINNEPYSFPLVNIDHVLKVPRTDIKEVEGRQYFVSKEKRIGIIAAQQVLDLDDNEADDADLSIIVMNSERNTYGLIIDSFLGIRDLVVQQLNPKLGKLRSISAAAIAEDGTPILILDIQDLVHSMDHIISGNKLKKIDPFSKAAAQKTKKLILVVDDSITVREVERKLLTLRGFDVDVAVDGLDAWNMIRNSAYDLIITDIDMPHMDGIELLIQIKASHQFESIPVIIISYKDREEDRNRGLDAGADYYLTKGRFNNQILIDAVEDLIGGPEIL